MEKKVRILALAPYEALQKAILRLARKRTDLAIDVYCANMTEAVEVARFHESDGYDVIISRGATAQLLKESMPIPVIAIEFSAFDILRAIRLADNYPYRYAIVGFSEITKSARILCDLLQKDVEIVTVYHSEDMAKALSDLKHRGYSMIVCGTVGEDYANKTGLSSILILSGDECIESAFDQAAEISKSYVFMREQKLLYEKVLSQEDSGFLLYDNQGKLCFSGGLTLPEGAAQAAASVMGTAAPAIETASPAMETAKVLPEEGIWQMRTFKNTLFSMRGLPLKIGSRTYTLFRFREEPMSPGASRQGILFSNRKQAENYYYNSFFGSSGALGTMEEKINALAKMSQPTVILGEEGCGKEQIARYLYINSPLCGNPLVTIDCDSINDKSWAWLMTGSGSPLEKSSQTYYFRNMECLSDSRCRQLNSVILERNLHQHSRILAACTTEKSGRIPDRIMHFLNQFSCAKIRMPALRQRKEELPILTSLYLSRKNKDLGKQILGFEPGAMALLQEYDWPYNYTQLKRILDELAAMTQTSYISRLHVSQLLEEERQTISPTEVSGGFDLDRTLEEINRDIILQTLRRMNNNQTAAARRLGISRTTLWRYLKD